MTDQLTGVEFRVFRSLLQESDRNTVEDVRIQLTRGPVVAAAEIEGALESLSAQGYVEEHEPGRWQISSRGHGRKKSLLGQRSD
jgi:hypothetical protein